MRTVNPRVDFLYVHRIEFSKILRELSRLSASIVVSTQLTHKHSIHWNKQTTSTILLTSLTTFFTHYCLCKFKLHTTSVRSSVLGTFAVPQVSPLLFRWHILPCALRCQIKYERISFTNHGCGGRNRVPLAESQNREIASLLRHSPVALWPQQWENLWLYHAAQEWSFPSTSITSYLWVLFLHILNFQSGTATNVLF